MPLDMRIYISDVVRQDVVYRIGSDKQEGLPEAVDCLRLQPERRPAI